MNHNNFSINHRHNHHFDPKTRFCLWDFDFPKSKKFISDLGKSDSRLGYSLIMSEKSGLKSRSINHLSKVAFVAMITLFFSCSVKQEKTSKIDRHAVVTRHNVENTSFDTLSSLTVGNGKFAFTVDATGLQTFPEKYEEGIPLGNHVGMGLAQFSEYRKF